MSIKKLTYYLEDVDITLRSDHLPLKKLAKNTLNLKVNNWAIKISPFRITFKYIKGIKNTLADTMSRLITIDPQIQETEPEGYEFAYYSFDTLPPIEISNIESLQEMAKNKGKDMTDELLSLPLDHDTLVKLQVQDTDCAKILAQI